MFKLTTPIAEIKGVPPKFIKKLANLNIKTVKDLLWHFPARYEDYSKIYNIEELIPGQQATIKGVVQKVNTRRAWRRQMFITEAFISDVTGEIRAIWWNQPYIKNSLQIGAVANFAGKIREDDGGFYFSNPAYEITRRNKETNHTARLVPIYPETRGLTSKGIRFLMKPLLTQSEEVKEFIPKEILEDQNLPEINAALQYIHFPEREEDALKAKKRFAFEELFLLQLLNLRQRQLLQKEQAPAILIREEEFHKIKNGLPFPLTSAQQKVTDEIFMDLKKSSPMNRLLQGDVGSGKTVVAAFAALAAAYNNHQTAFMAPTEILANQHYETLKKLFSPITQKVSIGLITSGESKIFYENDLETKVKKSDLKNGVQNGEVKIVIGTHALIQKDVSFKNLGLVIVDEQHRFGVRQRATLLQSPTLMPHFLSMSATPIPRTLTLTMFGDLDLSIIDEMPKGRRPIITKIVAPANRDNAYAFIRGAVKKGRQVFVICPRIAASENGGEPRANFIGAGKIDQRSLQWADVKNVTEEHEKLSKKIFPDLRVEMLHGKLKPKEKEEVMKKFKNRDFDILISTSVIEVGIDVPNATIMMIEGSDRFGLAQLYQFRGRVGRGEHQSFCLLFTDSKSKSTEKRLNAIVNAKNGFELAEMDLKIRGPGEFLGNTQSGMPDIVMRTLQNVELIKEARAAAEKVLKKDAELSKCHALKAELATFKQKIHLE